MEKIAIIGLSCLFPEAETPTEYWQNLIEEKDSSSVATKKQMGVDPDIFYAPHKGVQDRYYSVRGGYIQDFKFDPNGYRLPATHLEKLDDLFKWSLYVAREALVDSGYQEKKDVLANCGVVLGNLSFPTQSSNQLFAPLYYQAIEKSLADLFERDEIDLARMPVAGEKGIENLRISGYPAAVINQGLGLGGGNFALDAACASSLYAVKLAGQYLLSGKRDLMLAGAVSRADPFFINMGFSIFQAYPENQMSQPLNKDSGGLVAGEGAGMFVLKRHSDAVRDGDHIYAVISGVGLSNDGKGKFLLQPNPKGQILAFERAYEQAELDPGMVDYVECHATGTPVGDTTEVNSMDRFFGDAARAPSIGSAKSNFGHLLTVAGMAGMTKVILSMANETIPATIKVTEPISSQNNVISAEKIIQERSAWEKRGAVPRAAVSAFGFGGTNAHLILEKELAGKVDSTLIPGEVPLAIVGMDAFFGACDGLKQFGRAIYKGEPQFKEIPDGRWQGIEKQAELLQAYGFADGIAPKGAYISDFELDFLHFKIPPNNDQPIPQQLLLLKVADRAVRDAKLSEGGNVAVIVAMGTELALHRFRGRCDLEWQIRESLAANGISLTTEDEQALTEISKNSVHIPAQVNQYTSFIGNIMASRVSSQWDFSGPAFTLSAEENSAFRAVEVAQMLLAAGEVDAVVVGAVDLAGTVENVLLRQQMMQVNQGNGGLGLDKESSGWMVGEGAGAIVLKRATDAVDDRVYGTIEGISLVQQPHEDGLPQISSSGVTAASKALFSKTAVRPEQIDYLELYSSGYELEDRVELEGIMSAYRSTNQSDLRCAIGSTKGVIGHTFAASGIASLIKTADALYRRYLPSMSNWHGPKWGEEAVWEGAPFYVPTEPRPWFIAEGSEKRYAAINGLGADGSYAHLLLADRPDQQIDETPELSDGDLQLLLVGGEDEPSLLAELNRCFAAIEREALLTPFVRAEYRLWESKKEESGYTVALLNDSLSGMKQQISLAIDGIKNAFETGKEWKTPAGSYFTPRPLGKTGKVAFVYPGAFSAYPGLGQDLFYLFPELHQSFTSQVENLADLVGEKHLYPRSLDRLNKEEIEAHGMGLMEDSISLMQSGATYSTLVTQLMQHRFGLKPDMGMGYSLGEMTMMFATEVWAATDNNSSELQESPLFRNRLSGTHDAVRDYWGLPAAKEGDEPIWGIYLLRAKPEKIAERLVEEEKIFLTHVNSPREVVIAGDPTACEQLIKELKCPHLVVPYRHVIHNPAMKSEYDEFVRLNRLPISQQPEIQFYFAAGETAAPLTTEFVANQIASATCQPVDFPGLVQRVYEDGARIFLELGPRNASSSWIQDILKRKDHLAISIDRVGFSDREMIVQSLAQLASHQVAVDLTTLYPATAEDEEQSWALVKRVSLIEKDIYGEIVRPEHKARFKAEAKEVEATIVHPTAVSAPVIPPPMMKDRGVAVHQPFVEKQPERIEKPVIGLLEKNGGAFIPSPVVKEKRVQPVRLFPEVQTMNNAEEKEIQAILDGGDVQFFDEQLALIQENQQQMMEGHAAFLQMRAEGAEQIAALIGLQLELENEGGAAMAESIRQIETVEQLPDEVTTMRQPVEQAPVQPTVPTVRLEKISDADIRAGLVSVPAPAVMPMRVPTASPIKERAVGPVRTQPGADEIREAVLKEWDLREMPPIDPNRPNSYSKPEHVIWDEADLLEFAGGDIAPVFGDEYKIIDSYARRVRLPMLPYLLVSRITKLQGERGVYEPSKMTTEYDIPFGSWYTTDGQIPWAVAVESGQCDLMLISYLGIDFQNKGERVYRLLDCTLTFLEDIPVEGETLRYDISIDSFAASGKSLLFFFSYNCFVGDTMVLKMRGGCAGFFSDEELAGGKGIIITEKEKEAKRLMEKQYFKPLLSCEKREFNRNDMLALTRGDVAACFGSEYEQNGRNHSLRLPPEGILMVDRIVEIDPHGGSWGLGLIVSEKDLHPDHWYFPCHFKGDQVMAGSLVAEGCSQLLQVFLLYMGFQTQTEDARFQPVKGLPQVVRTRKQIMACESKLIYRLEITEIGLEPNPYAKANVDIIFEGRVVVDFKNLGLQIVEKEGGDRVVSLGAGTETAVVVSNNQEVAPRGLFHEEHIEHFAQGSISACFGPDYQVFEGRRIPRTPNGDLKLINRITEINGERLKFGGKPNLVSEYDVPENPWYCVKNSYPVMPYSILMEVGLQPCGFLSAYLGSTLPYPEEDFYFRNLDGDGELLRNIDTRGKTIVNRVYLLSATAIQGIIIQKFSYELSCEGELFYSGTAVFGYFRPESLAEQVGLDQGRLTERWYEKAENNKELVRIDLKSDTGKELYQPNGKDHYHLADGQLNFLDSLIVIPNGGEAGKGYVYGYKLIDPSDWFFVCHFYMDPVMPGSLGVEAIIQAMQGYALQQGIGSQFTNPYFTHLDNHKTVWVYRGQMTPKSGEMHVEVHITELIENEDEIRLIGEANLWREGMRIYQLKNIGIGIKNKG